MILFLLAYLGGVLTIASSCTLPFVFARIPDDESVPAAK